MYNVVLFNDSASINEQSRGIGAYRLATECRRAGFSTIVIDFVSAMSVEQFQKILAITLSDDTKVVGFSSTWLPESTFNYKSAEFSNEPSYKTDDDWHKHSIAQLIAQGKVSLLKNIITQIQKDVKVVIGGAKSFQYIEAQFDHVFIGHSENQFIDFLNGKANQKIIDYDRKANDGNFEFNTSTIDYVDTDVLHKDEILGLETSRGCIFNCTFCNYPHKNQKTKNYTKYKTVLFNELLSNWQKWGITQYYITDDTFNDYTDKLKIIHEVVSALPFQPIFWAYIRFDLIQAHPEQAKLLYDIGVRAAMYGLETWNDSTAKIIRKGSDKNKKIQGMQLAKKIWKDNVKIVTFYIVGLPQDTEASVYEYIDFFNTTGHDFIDEVCAFPLYLRDMGSYAKYAIQSEIESMKELYGYTMIKNKNWIRNDSGDINSFDQAVKVALTLEEKTKAKWKHTTDWTWNKLAENNFPNLSGSAVFFQFFNNYYYPKLMHILEDKKNEQ